MPKRRPSPTRKQIQIIRRSISRIDGALRRLDGFLRKADKARKMLAKVLRRRKARLSPERRAALKLQGRYMGYMRQLGARNKARVKVLKARRGFRLAIALARRLGGH